MDDNEELMAEVFKDAVDEAARQLEKAVAAANVETVLLMFAKLINEAWLEFQEDPKGHVYWDQVADWLSEMRETVAEELIPVVFEDDEETEDDEGC